MNWHTRTDRFHLHPTLTFLFLIWQISAIKSSYRVELRRYYRRHIKKNRDIICRVATSHQSLVLRKSITASDHTSLFLLAQTLFSRIERESHCCSIYHRALDISRWSLNGLIELKASRLQAIKLHDENFEDIFWIRGTIVAVRNEKCKKLNETSSEATKTKSKFHRGREFRPRSNFLTLGLV